MADTTMSKAASGHANNTHSSTHSNTEGAGLLAEPALSDVSPDTDVILQNLGCGAASRDRPISVILRYRVKKGSEPEYEKLMAEVSAYAHANAPGHLGTDHIRPLVADGEYVVIFKFDTYEHLVPWIKSPARARFLHQIQNLVLNSTASVECSGLVIVEHGSRVVALPPPPPPKWKLAFVLWLGVYVLASTMGVTLAPYLVRKGYPTPAVLAIIVLILVPILSYVVVPLLAKLMKPFLSGKIFGCGRGSTGWFCGSLNNGLPCLQPNLLRVAPLQARIAELEEQLLRVSQQNKNIFARLLNLELRTGGAHPIKVDEEVGAAGLQHRVDGLNGVNGVNVESGAKWGHEGEVESADPTLVAARAALARHQDSTNSNSEATVILRHTVKQEYFVDYEQWCRDIYCVARQVTVGHSGSTLVRPPRGSRVYTLIFKYDSAHHLEAWLTSPVRRHWVARVQPYLDSTEAEVFVGFFTLLESLFNDNAKDQTQAQPRKWKTALLTMLALYVVLLPVNLFLVPVLLKKLKVVWLVNLIATPIIVFIVSFVTAPLFGLWAEVWLHSPWVPSRWTLVRWIDSGIPGL